MHEEPPSPEKPAARLAQVTEERRTRVAALVFEPELRQRMESGALDLESLEIELVNHSTVLDLYKGEVQLMKQLGKPSEEIQEVKDAYEKLFTHFIRLHYLKIDLIGKRQDLLIDKASHYDNEAVVYGTEPPDEDITTANHFADKSLNAAEQFVDKMHDGNAVFAEIEKLLQYKVDYFGS